MKCTLYLFFLDVGFEILQEVGSGVERVRLDLSLNPASGCATPQVGRQFASCRASVAVLLAFCARPVPKFWLRLRFLGCNCGGPGQFCFKMN